MVDLGFLNGGGSKCQTHKDIGAVGRSFPFLLLYPSPEKKIEFSALNGTFWCILASYYKPKISAIAQ